MDKCGKKYFLTHENATRKFGSAYGAFAHNISYDSYQKWKEADDGLFGKMDWKAALEKKFNVKLD